MELKRFFTAVLTGVLIKIEANKQKRMVSNNNNKK